MDAELLTNFKKFINLTNTLPGLKQLAPQVQLPLWVGESFDYINPLVHKAAAWCVGTSDTGCLAGEIGRFYDFVEEADPLLNPTTSPTTSTTTSTTSTTSRLPPRTQRPSATVRPITRFSSTATQSTVNGSEGVFVSTTRQTITGQPVLQDNSSILPVVLGGCAGFLFLILVIGLVILFCRRRQKAQARRVVRTGTINSQRSSVHLINAEPKQPMSEENGAYRCNGDDSRAPSQFGTLISLGPTDKPLLFIDTASGQITQANQPWMEVGGVTMEETTDEATLRRKRLSQMMASNPRDSVSFTVDENGDSSVQWLGNGNSLKADKKKKKEPKEKKNKKNKSDRKSKAANEEKFARMNSTNSQKALLVNQTPTVETAPPDWPTLADNSVTRRPRTHSEGDVLNGNDSQASRRVTFSEKDTRSKSISDGLNATTPNEDETKYNWNSKARGGSESSKNNGIIKQSSTGGPSGSKGIVHAATAPNTAPSSPSPKRQSIHDRIRSYEQLGWCNTMPNKKQPPAVKPRPTKFEQQADNFEVNSSTLPRGTSKGLTKDYDTRNSHYSTSSLRRPVKSVS